MERDTIHAYFTEHYRPHNLVVAAAGNVAHDTILRLVDEHVGDLGRPGGTQPERSVPPAADGRVSVRNRPTEQAHVAIGGPALSATDDRRWAFRVLQNALGGGMSSRLFQEIRERRGLAYATYSYEVEHVDSGYHAAYAGTAPTHVEEVVTVLRDELDRIADDIDEAEVERAKGSFKGGLVLGSEDTGARMNLLGAQVVGDRAVITIDEAIELVDAVELDEVRAVAKQVLAEPRSMAVVGPFDEDDDRFAALLA
jgi:predicted Zn-dependent peptidase